MALPGGTAADGAEVDTLLSDLPRAAPGLANALVRPLLWAAVWIASSVLGLDSQPTNALCAIARAATGTDDFALLFCRALGARVPAAVSSAPFAHGVMRELVDRVRFFDARLRAALDAGVAQVVVLAAGFDSSAYRLGPAHPGTRFFEVDLPVVSARKRALVAACIPRAAANGVAFVGVDLAATPLAEALLPAGFDPACPTAWLVQGLLCYIPAAAVEALLRSVRSLSTPGSVVVFDALDLRSVTSPGGWPKMPFELLKALTDARGEPFQSCFDGARLPELARLLGFRQRLAEGTAAGWRAFGGMIQKVEWAVE